ncbi:family 43 glycosylhydrolase [Mucilaginibacter polytrichastri]|nr:family 43 glycosylhydrolase [Mucilaginibacter polytrichastri]
MKKLSKYLLLIGFMAAMATHTYAQNPLIMSQFTADPSARVFGDKVYVYPSHDIMATKGHGRAGWFNMADYHVFSSPNLTDWTDHGVIVSQNKVNWADSSAYAMWAPDCIARNGKYYFYFPAIVKPNIGRGFGIGVAIADKPQGPFVPQPEPIKGALGIDPNVFIDKDGQAYIYYAQGNIYAAKLKENMMELASEPKILGDLPEKGLKEGPYLFERKGIYYLTYPHVENKTERLEYAMASNPMGPFKFGGVIMKESPNCWTNHQSLIEFKGQWYLFYHRNDLSPNFDKNRSIRADSLFFNTDGTIREVIPTLRGVGVTRANKEIQIDRYSDISKEGVTIDFIDTAQRMKGWKTNLTEKGAWVRYNAVDFGAKKAKTVNVMATSEQGTVIEVRLDKLNGTLIGTIKTAKSGDWKMTKSNLLKIPSGTHDLFVVLKGVSPASIDWVRFD